MKWKHGMTSNLSEAIERFSYHYPSLRLSYSFIRGSISQFWINYVQIRLGYDRKSSGEWGSAEVWNWETWEKCVRALPPVPPDGRCSLARSDRCLRFPILKYHFSGFADFKASAFAASALAASVLTRSIFKTSTPKGGRHKSKE